MLCVGVSEKYRHQVWKNYKLFFPNLFARPDFAERLPDT